jgi:hypothetical protein
MELVLLDSKIILALDLATKTGFACSSGKSGVVTFPKNQWESSGVRWIRFADWLLKLCEDEKVNFIAYEIPGVHRSRAASHVAHSLLSQVEVFCERAAIDYLGFEASLVKTHALSYADRKLKRNKTTMELLASQRWPDLDIVDDNHADALWILDLAARTLAS